MATKRRPNPLKSDPTRTGMRREILIREMRKRFGAMKKEVTKLIVDLDIFGLRDPVSPDLIINHPQSGKQRAARKAKKAKPAREVTFYGGYDLDTNMQENFERTAKKLVGTTDVEKIVAATGAPDGATVEIKVREDSLAIEYATKEISNAQRTIIKDEKGRTYIENDSFFLEASAQDKGLGTKTLKRQVDAASKLGIDRIVTYGVGGAGEATNGYYTWPRLGYDAKIPAAPRFTGDRGDSKMLSDLMKTDKGRKEWKRNGSSLKMEFDLKDGSRSRKVLDAYVEKRFGKPTNNDGRGRQDSGQYLGRDRLIHNTAWKFLGDADKLKEFIAWLKTQSTISILANTGKQLTDEQWLDGYIQQTYKEGMGAAFDAVRKPELESRMDFYAGTKKEFLQQSFNNPASVERVQLLAGRAFSDLQGITEAMATQMRRTLVDGFIKGESPWDIARRLRQDVDGIGRVRAEMLARTEVIRAHNEGQLTAMENMGVEEVGVAVEWSTSGLGVTAKGNQSPCKLCVPLKGMVLPIKEARGMLPRHPNCMCSWIPANVGESEEGQKKTQGRIQSAIQDSLRAERPKSKMKMAERRRRTKWQGGTRRIGKKRPKSIIKPQS